MPPCTNWGLLSAQDVSKYTETVLFYITTSVENLMINRHICGKEPHIDNTTWLAKDLNHFLAHFEIQAVPHTTATPVPAATKHGLTVDTGCKTNPQNCDCQEVCRALSGLQEGLSEIVPICWQRF